MEIWTQTINEVSIKFQSASLILNLIGFDKDLCYVG